MVAVFLELLIEMEKDHIWASLKKKRIRRIQCHNGHKKSFKINIYQIWPSFSDKESRKSCGETSLTELIRLAGKQMYVGGWYGRLVFYI